MDAYINIATTENPSEFSQIPPEKLKIYSKEVSEKANKKMRDGKLRWTLTIYPTPFYANLAGMSLDAFEDYYFKVCCLDYKKLGDAMDKLVDKMKTTDKVRIVSNGTDISFSIKNIEVRASKGERNIPDGEVYTAPVLESVNGVITYNTPSVYQGTKFENVCLEFKDGKIIKATANNTQRLNEILDTDEGARYIGEFAIGVNPYIMNPMNNTLFDEKINGSIHFTPGFSLDLASNGNKSSIHWDLVLIQRPEYGGGEIYFDGELVRKDGLFVLPELQCLNPENF